MIMYYARKQPWWGFSELLHPSLPFVEADKQVQLALHTKSVPEESAMGDSQKPFAPRTVLL